MVCHRGASLSEHPLMFCHGTQTLGFVTVCSSTSMLSKTSCSHFSGQGTYYATHTLGLNFIIKSWAESLALMMSLCMALTWSKLNYCAWFDDTVYEQPALVCHGPRSVIPDIHVHASYNAVLLAWGSLRLTPIRDLWCTSVWGTNGLF